MSVSWDAMSALVLGLVCPGNDCVEKLNVVVVSGVAMAVEGRRRLVLGGQVNATVVPRINIEGLVA
jgi:hypothetical protein